MGEKIIVGPDFKGLQNNVLPFEVDNNSFPFLLNAYQWRGRIKRKRGTSLLGRLTRYFKSTVSAYTGTTVNPSYTITFNGAGNANLFGPYTNATPVVFSLQSNGNIVPGSVIIVGSVGPTTYTDPTKDGFLTPTGTGGVNTINYATGAIHIPGQAAGTATVTMLYYPDLPVMGLEDLNLNATQFPSTIAFDTVYSYAILNTFPFSMYDVSFYKNPPATAPYSYAGLYVPKTTVTPTTWNGQDYQQFWTVNYQGVLWATNGITVPFTKTNVGMQFAPAASIAYVSNTATTIVVTIAGSPLVVGDFVFLNEWTGVNASTLNFQSGFVTLIAGANITITLPNATVGAGPYTPGIIQYLTNRSDITKDSLRWFDGDSTDGNPTTPTLNGRLGWVNFAPPLSQSNFSIGDLPAAQYYLVGARMIIPFKDRLLFIGPVIQTSSANSQVYLQDAIIYSQNGTPYYTASFTGSPTASTTVFTPILTPLNQTSNLVTYRGTASAYFEDSTGFGGNIEAGYAQPILTASPNQDVIILGFSSRQARLIYTGDDIIPFNFYIINSELGSGSTFSIINMDRGVLTTGDHGIIATEQTTAARIDVEIPDEIFEFKLTNNGSERVTAQRDFINEWVYFTYANNQVKYRFPNQTLQYNYRDNSWAIFKECYTTYGQFRKASNYTWGTIGGEYPTWASWTVPWSAGASTLMQPKVIGGNQQGFILERDDGTNEGKSLTIQSFSGNTVTSPDHCLNNKDYIVINGALGSIGAFVNGKIFQVFMTTANTFMLNPSITPGAATYFGGALIQRIYNPLIQTRQFPPAWGMGRKTRIGAQQYLLSTTDNAQISLLLFLSENSIGDSAAAYNDGVVVPTPGSVNNSLIYSTVLYTCPESTNIGLTAPNTNLLQNIEPETGITPQQQMWHRVNTSLLGDTVQLGFTMSDEQLRSFVNIGKSYAITGITNAYPCVLTCAGSFGIGSMIKITGVVGTTQLNYDPDINNLYNVIAANATTVTINVDSTAFGVYVSGGAAISMIPPNQFAEIELHSFVIDVTPSSVLA